MKGDAVLAIDIGGSLTKVGIVSRKGDIWHRRIFPTQARLPFSDFLKRLGEETRTLTAEMDHDAQLIHVGVGAPNANPLNGLIENPPNLQWGTSIALKERIGTLFGLPVTIANDANAAALGEMMFGAAAQMKNFVVLTLGTGLGSGIVVNEKLLIGEHGVAGELGHVNVDPEGRYCNCGLRGCLETYASVTGIKRTVFELLANRRDDSVLRTYSFEELDGENIAEAALKGDAIAKEAFERTAEVLAHKMADTVAHVDPEAFIVSGGLSKAGDILLQPLRLGLERSLFHAYKGTIKILPSKATREEAVLGPAALAWMAVDQQGYAEPGQQERRPGPGVWTTR